MIAIALYTSPNKSLWKCNGLSDERVVTMAENEYGPAVKLLYNHLKSSKSILLNEWFLAISWSSSMSGIFWYKKVWLWNEHQKVCIFLSLINISVTTEWSFLLLITSAITSSKTIRTFLSFPRLYSLILF